MFVLAPTERWLPTSRLIAALAALCLWGCLLAAALAALHGPRALGYDVRPGATKDHWRVARVWPGSFAWDAGLRPGLEILDATVPPAEGTAQLRLLHGRAVATVAVPSPAADLALVWVELALGAVVLALGAGTLLYARERRPAALFLAFCLVVAAAQCGVAASARGAIWGSILFETCWFALLPPLTLLLATALPPARRGMRVPLLLPVGLGAAVLILEVTGFLHTGLYMPTREVEGALFIGGLALAGGIWIRRAVAARHGTDWPAYRLLFLGFIGAFGGFAALAIVPDMAGWRLPWPAEASGIVLLLFPASLSLALLRHRLLNLRRSMQRATITVCVLGGALAAGLTLAGAGLSVPAVGVAVLATGVGLPLAQRAADRLLPDGRARHADLVRRSGERLALAVTREDLVAALEDVRLGLGLAGLRLRQETADIAKIGDPTARVTCVLPVARDAAVLATLEVGEKLRQDGLLAADHQALAILCQQLGACLTRQHLTLELYGTVERLQRVQRRLLTARRLERERLGQHLHGGPLQGVMLLCQSLPPGGAEAAVAAQVGASLRALLTETASSTLRELGLAAALRALAEYMTPHARERGCALCVAIDPAAGALAEDESFALYALAREALINAVRHSGCRRVELHAQVVGARVQVVVRDDGRGLPAGWDTPRADHRGLRDALDLVRTVPGAAACVETTPGAGTTVAGSLPLSRSNQQGKERSMIETEGAIAMLIAEDHAMVREGLRRVLAEDEGLRVVAEARTGHEVLSLTLKHRPALLLLDLDMPGQGGLDAYAEVRAHVPEPPRAIVLSAFGNEEYVRRARELGVRGFLLKDSASERLREAVHRVANGGEAYDPAITATMRGQQYSGRGRLKRYAEGSDALSEAELDVLRRMTGDETYAEIAEALGRSEGTVRNQAAAVQDKLGVSSRQQAVLKALQLGILQLKDL